MIWFWVQFSFKLKSSFDLVFFFSVCGTDNSYHQGGYPPKLVGGSLLLIIRELKLTYYYFFIPFYNKFNEITTPTTKFQQQKYNYFSLFWGSMRASKGGWCRTPNLWLATHLLTINLPIILGVVYTVHPRGAWTKGWINFVCRQVLSFGKGPIIFIYLFI